MELKVFSNGMFGSNSYVLWNDGEGALIDAGVAANEVIDTISENGITLKYIILTHGHIDHICSVDDIKSKTGGNVVIHTKDAIALTNPKYNGSALFSGESIVFNEADKKVEDGDKLKLGSLEIEIIHTPGHSSGGICIRAKDCLFTGDTLFYRSVGRTDLGNGNYDELIDSIKNKILVLDESIVVYPGHGRSTTIGYEKNNNPYLRK